jgi:Icc-related predicted phosphoesterase
MSGLLAATGSLLKSVFTATEAVPAESTVLTELSLSPNQAFNIIATTIPNKYIGTPPDQEYYKGSAPQAANTTRIICISDTHSKHNSIDPSLIPPGDILLHCGDFSNVGTLKEVEAFGAWFSALPHKHKVVIAGNHDCAVHSEWYDIAWNRFHPKKDDSNACRECLKNLLGVIYLEDSSVVVEGYKIYGTPWQPEFCDWAFNLPRGDACREKWDLIPTDTDILMTHGPPVGHGDLTFPTRFRAGCVDLLDTVVNRVKPILHVYGHIHEGYGVTTNNETLFVNASSCTLRYKATNPGIVVDLPLKGPA